MPLALGAGQEGDAVKSGKLFVACSVRLASAKRSRYTRSFQSRIRFPSGQPLWQKGTPHSMQRARPVPAQAPESGRCDHELAVFVRALAQIPLKDPLALRSEGSRRSLAHQRLADRASRLRVTAAPFAAALAASAARPAQPARAARACSRGGMAPSRTRLLASSCVHLVPRARARGDQAEPVPRCSSIISPQLAAHRPADERFRADRTGVAARPGDVPVLGQHVCDPAAHRPPAKLHRVPEHDHPPAGRSLQQP